jgi:hypothetical protein
MAWNLWIHFVFPGLDERKGTRVKILPEALLAMSL